MRIRSPISVGGEVGTKEFREVIGEIAQLMCYEATRDLKLKDVKIKTPITEMTGKELAGKSSCNGAPVDCA